MRLLEGGGGGNMAAALIFSFDDLYHMYTLPSS